jgi:hypothetical protein
MILSNYANTTAFNTQMLATQLHCCPSKPYLIDWVVFVISKKKKKKNQPGVVVAHAFNPSTRETEAGGFLSSRPAWSTK